MNDIPHDIRQASLRAVKAMQDLCVKEQLFLGTVNAREVIRDIMSGAILAERERCALVAKNFSWVLPMFADMQINIATDDAACMVQEQIAAAIHNPHSLSPIPTPDSESPEVLTPRASGAQS